jgi:hypothetical protein
MTPVAIVSGMEIKAYFYTMKKAGPNDLDNSTYVLLLQGLSESFTPFDGFLG